MGDSPARACFEMLPRVLLISVRSDVGGGPAHVHELVKNAGGQVRFSAALPEDGYLHSVLQEVLGQDRVTDIPRQRFTLSALWKVYRFCRENQIDLIHSHGKGAGIYSRVIGLLTGLPVVHTLHGYHDATYGLWVKRLYALWESLAACVTRAIICVSPSEQVGFLDKVWINREKIRVVLNGTLVHKASSVEIDPRKIVTVARYSYPKNLKLFVDIAKQLPESVFHIYGDGEERESLLAYISNANVGNVVLHGEVQDVSEHIKDAAIYLSTSRWEGLPLAVLEAMSLGIPAVASDVVGNRDAVRSGETGYLYSLEDIEGCLRQIERARTLDRGAIRACHQKFFSAGRMAAETFEVYRGVLPQ